MAELAFTVRADYQEAIRMRDELARLRHNMEEVNTTTEEGAQLMAEYQKQYQTTYTKLSDLVERAAQDAVLLQEKQYGVNDAMVEYLNTIRKGEQLMNSLGDSIKTQMDEATQSVKDSQEAMSMLLDEMVNKVNELKRERNLADAQGDNERVKAIEEEIAAMEDDIAEKQELQRAFEALSDSVNKQIQEIYEAASAYAQLSREQASTGDTSEEMMSAVSSAFDTLLSKVEQFQDVAGSQIPEAVEGVKNIIAEYKGKFSESIPAVERLTKAQALLGKSSVELAANIAKMVLPAEAARVAIAGLRGGLAGLGVAVATLVIKKVIEHFRKLKQEAEEARQKQEEFNETIAKGAAPAISKFEALRSKWVSLKTEMEKTQFLKDNEKALKDLGLTVSSLDAAEALFVENTQAYWDAQVKRARADAYRAEITKKIQEQLQLEDSIKAKRTRTRKITENGNTRTEEYRVTGDNLSTLFTSKEIEAIHADEKRLEEVKQEILDLGDSANKADQSYRDYLNSINRRGKDANYEARAKELKADWESAKKTYDDIQKDASRTVEQEQEAKNKLTSASAAYKALTGISPEEEQRAAEKAAEDARKAAENRAKEQNTAYDKYKNDIIKLITSTEGEIAQTRINSTENENERILQAINDAYDEQIETAKAHLETLREAFAGNEQDESVKAQLQEAEALYGALVKAADALKQAKIDAHNADTANKEEAAMRAYLMEYGNYWEQRLATAKYYDDLITKAQTEGEKKRLAKQKEAALASLDADKGGYGSILSRATDVQSRKNNINRSADAELERLAEKEKELRAEIVSADSDEKKKALEEELANNLAAQKVIEDERRSALYRLAVEEGDLLKNVFGNISKYTNAQLKEAKKKLDEFKKSDEYKGLSPADRKAIDEQYASISEAEFNKMFDIGNGNPQELVKNELYFKHLAQERKKAEMEGDKERYDELTRQMEQVQEQINKQYVWFGIDSFLSSLQKASEIMKEIGEMTEDEGLKQAGDVIGSVTQNLKAAEEGAQAWGGWWGAIIGGVTDLIAQGEEAWANGEKGALKYERAVEAAKNNIRNLRIEEQLRENGAGIFGQDSEKQIDSINKALSTLEKTRKSADKSFTTYFNKGFLGFIGREERHTSLADIAKDMGAKLYDEYGNLNADTLKTILNTYDTLTVSEREWIEQAIKDTEHYEEGIKQLQEILSGTFSNTASMLADATIDGLSRGATIGSDRMKEIMSGTAQDLQKQLVQNIYAKYLDQYSDEALKIMERGGNEKDLVDLYARMFDNMQTTIDTATIAAQDFQEYAEARGFRISELANAETGAKAYSNISETTGSAIEGRLTSLQISSQVKESLLNMMNANVSQIAMQMSMHVAIAQEVQGTLIESSMALQRIQENTANNAATVARIEERLIQIDKKL